MKDNVTVREVDPHSRRIAFLCNGRAITVLVSPDRGRIRLISREGAQLSAHEFLAISARAKAIMRDRDVREAHKGAA